MLRRIAQGGSDQETLRRVVQALNFGEVLYPWTAVTGAAAFGALTFFGGPAIDRSVFRFLLPDTQWVVYAAGLVDPADANTATVSLQYTKDDGAHVVLGSTTATGAGLVKRALGPFDVFATAGVPAAETIPVIQLAAQKDAGAAGALSAWTIVLRLVPNKQ